MGLLDYQTPQRRGSRAPVSWALAPVVVVTAFMACFITMVFSGHAGPILPVFSVLGPTALILVFAGEVMNLVGIRGGMSDAMSLVVVALMVTAQYVAYFALTRTHSRSAMRFVLIVHFGCVAMAYIAAKVF